MDTTQVYLLEPDADADHNAKEVPTTLQIAKGRRSLRGSISLTFQHSMFRFEERRVAAEAGKKPPKTSRRSSRQPRGKAL